MLEYNADTPTALLEASVVQWYWLQDVLPDRRPVQLDPRAADRALEADARRTSRPTASCTSPASPTSAEDQGNLDYLRDTAMQAGIDARPIDIADIGWDGKRFRDLDERADHRALQALSVGVAGRARSSAQHLLAPHACA